MSNLLSLSSLIEPVIRQARRLSSSEARSPSTPPSQAADQQAPPLDLRQSHACSQVDGDDPDVTALASAHRSHHHSHRHHLDGDESSASLAPAAVRQHVRRRQTHPPHVPRRSEQPIDGAAEHPSTSPRRHANSIPATPFASATTPTDERSSNPAYGTPHDFRSSAEIAVNHVIMSGSLPADDGMRILRQRMHEIQNTTAPNEEKARKMHAIMTERYLHVRAPIHTLRPTSPPASITSQDLPRTSTSTQSTAETEPSVASPAVVATVNTAEFYNISTKDLLPSFRPADCKTHTEVREDEAGDDGPARGCKHYQRNVKVQCFDCRRWYPCRHCHDAEESHALVRQKTENMLCTLCSTPQPAAEYCRACGESTAYYYCDICKLWDDDNSKKIYHCLDCGICRRGEGLGKDFVHCKKCNVCISIGHADSHKCIERATDCDCPICGDYLFNSSTEVASMPCGHYMHRKCYDEYMNVAYKCPFCKKSAVNMELSWRKLTHAIEAQPMPSQFANTRVHIQCNDCSAKSLVKYHWLGNQCAHCDSYNTNEIQVLAQDPATGASQPIDLDVDMPIPSPDSPPFAEARGRDMVASSALNADSASSPPQRPSTLRAANGSYFHQDPTPPVAVASVRRPSAAASALEAMRLSPYEMLQRVSRSLSPIGAYLHTAQESGRRLQERVLRGDDMAVDDEGEVDFWGNDGRFLSGEEDEGEDDDDDEEDDSSDDEDLDLDTPDEDEDDDEMGSGHALDELDSMPWHA